MLDPFFLHIFAENGMGVAAVDADLRIRETNRLFDQYAKRPTVQKWIGEALPEVIGLEEVLNELLAGKRESFKLEKLHRDSEDGSPVYFDLAFYRMDPGGKRLLCVLRDRSAEAQIEQQLLQKRNEVLLLESMLAARGDFLAGSILGQSEPIQALRNLIRRIALIQTATVLLQGESGTGKSLVARVIHFTSPNRENPFVEINCAAIPETLLESELFGYEKGAFTGATASKKGLIEEADGGTLFLDEIGEMSATLQAKLLSFLETKRFRRLGSTREVEVKIRLIAASNKNLEELVENGEFREDLFYRLNVVRIELPPLRKIKEDIPLIASHFVQVFNAEFGKEVRGLTPGAERALMQYRWPGNVRELRNAIERAMIFAEKPVLELEDFGFLFGPGETKGENTVLDHFRLPPEGIPFAEIEQKLLREALELAGGNQTKAARLLHMSRDTFRYRLEKYGLHRS